MNLVDFCPRTATFALAEQAREVLSACKEPFSVMCMMGIERAGKSTLASLIAELEGAGVFPFSSGEDGVTKAIKCAPRPNAQGLLVLDFEGFAQSKVHNMKLLVMACLLGHIVTYNTSKQIRESDIENLQSAGLLANQIMGDDKKAADVQPSLLWLLRDFDLSEGHDKNAYLTKILDAHPDKRTDIETVFIRRECIALAHPGTMLPGNRYPPAMQAGIQHVRAALANLKTNKAMTTGTNFLDLVTLVCEAVNSSTDKLDLGTAWQARLRAEEQVAFFRRQEELRQQCQDLAVMSPDEWERLISNRFPDERVKFKEMFGIEQERNARKWVAKRQKAVKTVTVLLQKCQTLQDLERAFTKMDVEFKPREFVEYGLGASLALLRKKLAVVCEEKQEEVQTLNKALQAAVERVAQVEAMANERMEDAVRSRDALVLQLKENHEKEVEHVKSENGFALQRTVILESELQKKDGEMQQHLHQKLETAAQLEDSQAELARCKGDLQDSQTKFIGIKRTLEQRESEHNVEVKRLKGEQATLETQWTQRHNDEVDLRKKLEEALSTREYELKCEREFAQQIKARRDELEVQNRELAAKNLTFLVRRNSEVELQARNDVLTKRVERLQRELWPPIIKQ